ncbi:uncharacterized protein RJT20DRAFT_130004 [Scheffersomyces xylosifermentans]|uniref:uncharacterized protein n=1 Tax=Scheffersomyces xylosifermentans TaxID=1304137 RepID=UPI00315DD1BC
MIYETTISPGEGLGNAIKLGDSLYSIIKRLDKFNYKFRISYSNNQFLEVPIMVRVADLGIRLTFRNHGEQTLDLIEVLDIDNRSNGGRNSNSEEDHRKSSKSNRLLKLVYNGVSLNEFESAANSSTDIDESPSGSISESPLLSKNSSSSTILETTSSYSSSASSNSTFHSLLSSGPTLKSVYNKIFGPTYPGTLNKEKKTYILSYPGISFKFAIVSDQVLEKLHDKDDDLILSNLLNWDNPYDVKCTSIALYKGNSWSEFEKSFSGANSKEVGQSSLQSTTGMKAGTRVRDEISKLDISLKDGLINIMFKSDSKKEASTDTTRINRPSIRIGKTTQQQVLNILGPPDDYFNKFDSRLLIHKHLSVHPAENNGVKNSSQFDNLLRSNDNDLSHYKFHNYFRYGIDILYDLNSNRSNQNQSKLSTTVKKVIVHNGGITESLNFMKWNRCNWEITTSGDGGEIKFNSGMYFHQLPQNFRDLTPVLLNRIESEFIDNDLDIIEFPNESARNKSEREKEVDSADEKVKTWGQTKLYGFDRCILEVLNSNGCISSVTIY